jgi:hypothetical protein
MWYNTKVVGTEPMTRLDLQPPTKFAVEEAVKMATALTAMDEDGWTYKVAIFGGVARIDVFEEGERLGHL